VVRRAVDTRIFLVGFIVVTALLLAATIGYWSTYTDGGVPYPWVGSYVIEPVIGAAILVHLRLWHPAEPGHSRVWGVFLIQAIVFAALGIVLVVSPAAAIRVWPWALTAVLARTYAAIFIAFAAGAFLAARERRPQAVAPFALASLVLLATTATISLVHRARFDGGLSTYAWAAALAAGIAGFAGASALTLRRADAA
jgi:hypothetical protein